MDRSNIIECGGFYFIHNFDSGNLGHVERVPTEFIGKLYYVSALSMSGRGISANHKEDHDIDFTFVLIIAPTINPKTNAAETPDYEFNLWTRPDCAGTEFENGNRTWFYFGIQASEANVQVLIN